MICNDKIQTETGIQIYNSLHIYKCILQYASDRCVMMCTCISPGICDQCPLETLRLDCPGADLMTLASGLRDASETMRRQPGGNGELALDGSLAQSPTLGGMAQPKLAGRLD